jgi:SAM-dependent methyltransferase
VDLSDPSVARSWEEEYRNGRYLGEPPVPFVEDILAAARDRGLSSAPGLYIGCGNGRNYLPLVSGGLDLLGLDVSPTAIAQLSERAPERASRLLCGDLTALPAATRYSIVIAIQVLQHGNETTVHDALVRARELVAPGGLFCVRVNAVGTQPEYEHDVVGRAGDGRFTVRYKAGPKRGLDIHFFSEQELRGLVGTGFTPLLELRPSATRRPAPGKGEWVQWEAIWQRDPGRSCP